MKAVVAVLALAALSVGGLTWRARAQAPVAPPAPGAALITAMAPNSWARAPNSHLRAVAPERDAYPAIQLGSGVTGVIRAWSGGALDTRRDRLLVWGGGGTDYAGNELYAFDIAALSWRRLTEPVRDPRFDQESNTDGTPVARATYGGLVYLARSDQLFSRDGAIAGGEQRLASWIWTCDLATARWSGHAPNGGPPAGRGSCCAYDPETGLVWWCSGAGGYAGLWSYDPASDAWTKRNEDNFYERTCVIDPRRGRLVVVGDGELVTYDVRRGDFMRHEWKTTGGDALIAHRKPGFDYDAKADRFVGWSGGAVYALDPESATWTAYDAPEPPKVTATADYETGIYGRWRWVPDLGVFVVVTDVDDDVRFYKPAWAARD
jgi:hypothetical protein